MVNKIIDKPTFGIPSKFNRLKIASIIYPNSLAIGPMILPEYWVKIIPDNLSPPDLNFIFP